MSLPLLARAREDGVRYVLTPPVGRLAPAVEAAPNSVRIPQRKPLPGEQYRFHFDMTTCVGCKCCVVACNEQNGNPAEINWRRVGEIEGGWFPETKRFHVSMGCNHCLEPSCLIGCPVDAYTKDPATGVVLHSAETCIGCQYCTWNCSYGVPQYNPERGVVGKCDMCHTRLAEGREPACANACPTGSIKIEIVNVADWKKQYAGSANAPGLPSADDSLSSTRVTLPDSLPPNMSKADSQRVRPEHPHWPLVIMTVLTQLSVGSFSAIWLLQLLSHAIRLEIAALASLAVGGLALAASTMHLGRPAHAYRALKMWRRSWLSREVLMFSLFAVTAGLYAGSLWLKPPMGPGLGLLTSLLGILGVTASACIYLVPARPAWNTKHTVAEFYLTGALLGPLFAISVGQTASQPLKWIAVVAATVQLYNLIAKFLRLVRSDVFELHASGRLLSKVLGPALQLRAILLIVGGVILPLLLPAHVVPAWVALAVALAGEILGRYLFFVSVVPKNIAATYLTAGGKAA